MALAFAKLSPNPDGIVGNRREHFRKVTFDSAYPDGGEAVTAANFDLSALYFVEVLSPVIKSDEESAYVCGFDADASKLVVYEGDNNNAADAPLIEIDTTNPDISSFRVYVKAIGY
jgi:hypothetical protein